jgi:hypothetical protein
MFYSCTRGMGGVTVGPLLGVLVTYDIRHASRSLAFIIL